MDGGGGGVDGGAPTDAPRMVFDVGPRPDAGPQPPCNPTDGIECDGDWADRCTPACAATECCSPQIALARMSGGRPASPFVCVARDAAGNCPAADLWVDDSRITGAYRVEWRHFAADDCAIAEGCVAAEGWRRLLYFDTWTPNTGTADMYLGRPSGADSTHFEYSDCHMHYHFNTYAEYELLGGDGSVAATGHKQAFCLLDYYRYPGTDETGAYYTCENQGIGRDWQDVYDSSLDCQWVDVTDVAPGEYSLHIAINTERILLESDYTNNEVRVPVVIPPDDSSMDVTTACPGEVEGGDRDCGWTRLGAYTCTPGAMVTLGCSAACSLGSCTGDTVLRICDAANDPNCVARYGLGSNDDSGCGSGACGSGGDCCSQAMVTCPAGGRIVAFAGPYRTSGSATCTAAATGATPAP